MNDPKRFSTLAARMAICGIELYAVQHGAEEWTLYAVDEWGPLDLGSIRDAEAWADRHLVKREASGAA